MQDSNIEKCAICLDEVSGLATFTNPDPECNHKFHPHCIGTWMTRPTKMMLEKQKSGTEESTCPTCRNPIDLQADEFLKAYSEVIAYYEVATLNISNNLPYMDEVMLNRLYDRDDNGHPFVTKVGLVSKEFWETEPELKLFKEFLSNVKKCLTHMYDKAPVLARVYEDLLSSRSIADDDHQLNGLFEQIRNGLAICNEVMPPYEITDSKVTPSGVIRHSLERDFNQLDVKGQELKDFPDRIAKCLKGLNLGSLFEFIYHIKIESNSKC